MDFEELKERYRLLPFWVRMGAMFVLGIIPGLYLYFKEIEALETKVEEQRVEEAQVRARFEDARRKKAKLPELEETLSLIIEEMSIAKKKLPEQVLIDEVLEEIARIAKEVSVSLVLFD